MPHLVHDLDASSTDRKPHVVVSNPTQRIVPHNFSAIRIQTKQMPIATGVNLSVVIEHCHILVARCGQHPRFQFRPPQLSARAHVDRRDVSVTSEI